MRTQSCVLAIMVANQRSNAAQQPRRSGFCSCCGQHGTWCLHAGAVFFLSMNSPSNAGWAQWLYMVSLQGLKGAAVQLTAELLKAQIFTEVELLASCVQCLRAKWC
jgi:hypothetical protein